MTRILCRQICLVALLVVALLVPGTPAGAMATCFRELFDCYERAALIDSAWDWTAYALDCELSFIGCAREYVFGD